MKRSPARPIAWIVTLAIALAAHILIKDATFSFIPLSFLLSILLALLMPSSLMSIVTLGLVMETASISPAGLNMAIVLVPWLVRQLFPFVTLELSFSLLGLLLGMTFLQTTISFLPGLAQYGVPWRIYVLTIFLTALLAYSIILIWQEYIPPSLSSGQPRRLA